MFYLRSVCLMRGLLQYEDKQKSESSVYISVCLSVYSSVYLSASMPLIPFITLSVFLCLCLSLCPPLILFISLPLFFFLSVSMSVFLLLDSLSDCFFACVFIPPSLSLSFSVYQKFKLLSYFQIMKSFHLAE